MDESRTAIGVKVPACTLGGVAVSTDQYIVDKRVEVIAKTGYDGRLWSER